MPEAAKPVVLILADISGYTKFMLRHRTCETHSQVIVSELMRTILDAVELPMEIAKLEGDAIFAYALQTEDPATWAEHRRTVAAKLLTFFDLFVAKVAEIQGATVCSCGGCRRVDQLRLKIIVHAGQAIFHRLGRFEELHGVDVIIAHRLLKNSVPSNQYLLVTDAARQALDFPDTLHFDPHEEECDDVGRVAAWVNLCHAKLDRVPDIIRERHHNSLLSKVSRELKLISQTLLHSLRLRRLPAIRVE